MLVPCQHARCTHLEEDDVRVLDRVVAQHVSFSALVEVLERQELDGHELSCANHTVQADVAKGADAKKLLPAVLGMVPQRVPHPVRRPTAAAAAGRLRAEAEHPQSSRERLQWAHARHIRAGCVRVHPAAGDGRPQVITTRCAVSALAACAGLRGSRRKCHLRARKWRCGFAE
eukprot:356939-Chlamydomonas_euryale.AAC.6